MYLSVRCYDGVDPASVDEIVRLVGEEGGFASIISKTRGFIAYYTVDAGDGVVASISAFENRAGTEESNRMAADWVNWAFTICPCKHGHCHLTTFAL